MVEGSLRWSIVVCVATRDFLTRQANTLSGDTDDYGFRWQAPPQADDHPNFATQTAAIALNAASAAARG